MSFWRFFSKIFLIASCFHETAKMDIHHFILLFYYLFYEMLTYFTLLLQNENYCYTLSWKYRTINFLRDVTLIIWSNKWNIEMRKPYLDLPKQNIYRHFTLQYQQRLKSIRLPTSFWSQQLAIQFKPFNYYIITPWYELNKNCSFRLYS